MTAKEDFCAISAALEDAMLRELSRVIAEVGDKGMISVAEKERFWKVLDQVERFIDFRTKVCSESR